LKHLKRRLPWVEVAEQDVETWKNFSTASGPVNMLQNFHERTEDYAFEFESLVLQTMSKRRYTLGTFFLQERSMNSALHVYSAALRGLGYLRDDQFGVLETWVNFVGNVRDRPTCPHGVLYVDVDPDVALSRIQARGRPEEAFITVEYLSELKRRHDVWLVDSRHHPPVFRVDGTLPVNTLVPAIAAQLRELAYCDMFRRWRSPKVVRDIVTEGPLPGRRPPGRSRGDN
jgi:deoxyadenosine/deoxycytidine kinase